jgi:long-chain acyl-CoA synthetase
MNDAGLTTRGAAESCPSHDPSAILAFWAAKSPSAPAVRDSRLALTFGALEAAVAELSDRWRDLGVQPGDRVAILGENEAGVVAAIFAAWRAGAWAVPLNARYTTRELDTILSHADPACVVAVGAAKDRHAGRFADLDWVNPVLDLHVVRGVSRPEPTQEADPGDRVVLMLYTSGTTGAPKGVMLPARALTYMASLWSRRPLVAGDRVYQILPLSHSYGLCSYLYGALNLGCEVELVSRFDPEALRAAFEGGITLFQGVPAMFARYLAHLVETGRSHAAPSLKMISTGGAPLDPGLKADVERVFGMGLRQAYGLTEAGPTATVPAEPPQPATAVGRPAPGAEIRLIDPLGDQRVEDGPGELWVRSPGIMRGYYRDPAATASALTEDGWLRTGDLARLSDDGVLHLVGRAKDVIIRSGFNVYPTEVEAVLGSHPDVVQAAVLGRPERQGDESVVAFVQLAAGSAMDARALLDHCAVNLAGYKRPTEIRLLPALPLGLNGKVSIAALRALLAEAQPSASSPTDRDGVVHA